MEWGLRRDADIGEELGDSGRTANEHRDRGILRRAGSGPSGPALRESGAPDVS